MVDHMWNNCLFNWTLMNTNNWGWPGQNDVVDVYILSVMSSDMSETVTGIYGCQI